MVRGVDGQNLAGTSALVRHANFVKLPHTLFALPFALVGVTLGTWYVDVRAATVGWVVLAFTAARFAAMGFNRIVDREFDARNPRTAMRELPTGTMSVREAWIAVLLSSFIFLLASRQLNGLCFALSPVALALVFFYSYTKRFTRWSHLALGLGLGIAPVGGFLAVTGFWSTPWWMLVALAGAVMTWTAGFDIIYAMQDVDIDRAEGLHSIPASLGVRRALGISLFLHMIAVVALMFVGKAVQAGLYYGFGLAVVVTLLIVEQWFARRGKVQAAFFVVNFSLSALFLLFVVLDRVLPYIPLFPAAPVRG